MCILLRVRYPIALLLLTVGAGLSCRSAAPVEGKPQIVQPGAPGQPSHVIAAAQASDLSQVQYTGADIKFMQGMIGHHAQAVEMVALVPSRTASDDVRKLAQRIDVSQKDEMNMMREWLQSRGQQIPDPRAHHLMGATLMPGMLTSEEMGRLSAASGAAFDRLFLEGMIKHHSGAITMVHDLFATDGAGQTPEMFSYASDVDADQRMEIDRMGSLLKELQK
jgi:uncharacterized protein (DUF305 family)